MLRRILALLMLLAGPLCPGCVGLYSHRTLAFRFIDGDTGEAVPSARVDVTYDVHPLLWNKPGDRQAVTDAAGEARLPVANWYGVGFSFSSAHHREHNANAESGRREPEGLARCPAGAGVAACYVVVLYRPSRPSIELVVPDGYTGPIAIEFRPGEGLGALAGGRRKFEWRVSAGGALVVENAPEVLFRESIYVNGVRTAAGALVPPPTHELPDAPALRYVQSDPADRRRMVFVLGSGYDEWRMAERLSRVTYHPSGARLIEPDAARFDETFSQLIAGAARVRAVD